MARPVLSAVTSTRLFGHRSPGDRAAHLEGGQQVELHKRRTQLLQQPRPRGIRRGVPGPAALRPGDVIVAAKMDRCFRSAFDALATIEGFKRRKTSLWLLDLGGDVSANGISELIMPVLAAVAQFERSLISERIKDAKRNLRRGNKHQGGKRPFGWQFGQPNGHGRARELVPDEAEQKAIAEMTAMRGAGASLMAISDAVRAQGHAVSHQTVANILARSEAARAPVEGAA